MHNLKLHPNPTEQTALQAADCAIAIDANTRMHFATHFTGTGQHHFTRTFTLGKNAQLIINQFENYDTGSAFVVNDNFILQEGSTLCYNLVQAGAGHIKRTITIQHEGAQAISTLRAVNFAQMKNKCELETRMEHNVPNTQSVQDIRSIAADGGFASFVGSIYVHENAQKTDAQQIHHGMLLSDKAQIFMRPALEIYADDVQCSHGATCGALDENAIFYMQSRGLKRDVAQGLLLRAFVESPFAEQDDHYAHAPFFDALHNLMGAG